MIMSKLLIRYAKDLTGHIQQAARPAHPGMTYIRTSIYNSIVLVLPKFWLYQKEIRMRK